MNKKIMALALALLFGLSSLSLAAEIPTDAFFIPVEKDFVDVNATDWYYSAAKYAKANGIFKGNEKGEFSPKSNITKAEMSQILFNIKTKENGSNTFTIDESKWYSDAMEYALNNYIISSANKATDFGAGSQLSRNEVFLMMYNFALSEDFVTNEVIDKNILSTFADFNSIQSNYKDSIAWLANSKIVNGQLNGKKLYIAPNASITRAEVATIMKNFNEFTSNQKQIETKKDGKNMTLKLKGNPTTGYVWNTYDYDSSIIKVTSTYESSDKTGTLMGAGGKYTFTIQGLKEGTTKLTFKYLRTWEGEDSALESHTYEIKVDKNKNVSFIN